MVSPRVAYPMVLNRMSSITSKMLVDTLDSHMNLRWSWLALNHWPCSGPMPPWTQVPLARDSLRWALRLKSMQILLLRADQSPRSEPLGPAILPASGYLDVSLDTGKFYSGS